MWLTARLAGRQRLDRQRVHTIFQLVPQHIVDDPVTLNARLAGEVVGDDQHAEVALARSGRRAVTGVQVQLIDHVEARGIEGDHQLFAHACLQAH